LSGTVDYLLKVVVPDIAGFDAFYKRLIAVVPLYDVSTSFSMERIKETTALPLGLARIEAEAQAPRPTKGARPRARAARGRSPRRSR
jgi:Lrp/AsnC family transcriptional regulator